MVKTSSANLVTSQKPQRKKSFLEERPYLTSNFLKEPLPADRELGPLKNIPADSQVFLELLPFEIFSTETQNELPVKINLLF